MHHAPQLRAAAKNGTASEKARLDAFLCLLLVEEAAKVTAWRPGKDLLGDITLQGDTFATTETLGKKTPAPIGYTSVQVYPGGEYNPSRSTTDDTNSKLPPLPTLPKPDLKPSTKTKAATKRDDLARASRMEIKETRSAETAATAAAAAEGDQGVDDEKEKQKEPPCRWQNLPDQGLEDGGTEAGDSGGHGGSSRQDDRYSEASYSSGYDSGHAAVFAADEYEEDEYEEDGDGEYQRWYYEDGYDE